MDNIDIPKRYTNLGGIVVIDYKPIQKTSFINEEYYS